MKKCLCLENPLDPLLQLKILPQACTSISKTALLNLHKSHYHIAILQNCFRKTFNA